MKNTVRIKFMKNQYREKRGFTLIELLVVISIIALLIGILLPSLSMALDAAKDIKCKANMRSINIGMQMYRDDHKGYGNEHRNQGARFNLLGARLDSSDTNAYWAIPYDEYLSDALEVWEDPKFRMMDPYPYYSTDPGFIYDTQRYQTYGINAVRPGVNDKTNPRWKTSLWKVATGEVIGRGGIIVRTQIAILRPLTQIAHPTEMIVFQDAWEHALDDNGDTLNNLSQYDNAYSGYFKSVWRDEYFRHGDSCNAMMADGHVAEFDRGQVTERGRPELKFYYTGFAADRIVDGG